MSHTRKSRITSSIAMAALLLFLMGAAQPTGSGSQTTEPPISRATGAIADQEIPKALQGDFDSGDIAAATAWADQLHLADWLGPLAPLALSPFFGVACLSGLALWGPEWITDNALLRESGPLCSVPLFCVFAVLALLTSLPRLSKVSKPFAQAMDQLEAYAVIVILLAIKLTASYGGSPVGAEGAEMAVHFAPVAESAVVYQAGVLSFTADGLLMIAMVINLLVINSVKFFFECLVWLTPFPTVDAIFEACNKMLCAALMAVYAFSPTLATVINLVILLVALILFRWVGRRVRFYRMMLLDPVLARIWAGYGQPSDSGLMVFPKETCGPYPAKSCLRLVAEDDGWRLLPAQSWSPLSWGLGRQGVQLSGERAPRLIRGWLTHSIEVDCDADASSSDSQATVLVLTFSRRHDKYLDTLAARLRVVTEASGEVDSQAGVSSAMPASGNAAIEFG